MIRVSNDLRNKSLLCLLLFILATCFESGFQKTGVTNGYLPVSTHQNQSVALVEATGEFRIVAANVLWAKVVDHYHHQYMADGGNWAKNESLLPILHTIIQLDPHFVQAYELAGGTILPNTGHILEGHALLAEGLKNNPNEWEIYRELAMMSARDEHEPIMGLQFAKAGLGQTNDEFSHHLMQKLCKTLEDQVASQGAAKKS